MENVPGANRFAPPAAAVDDVVVDGDSMLAGRGARLLAVIVDGILGFAVAWVVTLVPVFGRLHPTMNRFGPNAVVIDNLPVFLAESLVLGFVVYMALNGYLLQTRGQTIGKMLMKVRIVRSDGSPASLLRLVGLRYLANSLIAVIPFVGTLYVFVDALMIFRASHKCLHDNIADTIVVKV